MTCEGSKIGNAVNYFYEIKERMFICFREKVPSLNDREKVAGFTILAFGCFYFHKWSTGASVALGWFADKKVEQFEKAFMNFWNSSAAAKVFLTTVGVVVVYSKSFFIPMVVGIYLGENLAPTIKKFQNAISEWSKTTRPPTPQKQGSRQSTPVKTAPKSPGSPLSRAGLN